MTKEEINNLVILAKSGDSVAKNKLASSMDDRARVIANSYSRRVASGDIYIEEYLSSCYEGLAKAIRDYDPDKGDFDCFASTYMGNEVKNFISGSQRTISIPRSQLARMAELERVRRSCEECGRSAELDDYLKGTDLTKNQINTTMRIARLQNLLSLDATNNDENGSSFISFSKSNIDTEEILIESCTLEKVKEILADLSERDREIICSDFGAFGYEKLDSDDCARKYGLSVNTTYTIRRRFRERVRAII